MVDDGYAAWMRRTVACSFSSLSFMELLSAAGCSQAFARSAACSASRLNPNVHAAELSDWADFFAGLEITVPN